MSELADVDGDADFDVLTAAAKPDRSVLVHTRPNETDIATSSTWTTARLPAPEDEAQYGSPKAIAAADIQGDGDLDVLVACEEALANASGLYALLRDGAAWVPADIAGSQGVKFDRLDVIDLDGDADVDVLTSEEDVLGVLWYENPGGSSPRTRPPPA